jgi:Lrp/AsnC family transcriptional regulator for asnA, asnC and gidA
MIWWSNLSRFNLVVVSIPYFLKSTLNLVPFTIHVRIKKLQDAGIVKGTRFNVDFKKLGYDVIAFIGIYLKESSMYDAVAKELGKMPEIVRLNYTTGNYSMFAEVVCRDIGELKMVLHDQLQKIKGIERTETFISLEESFNRTVKIA